MLANLSLSTQARRNERDRKAQRRILVAWFIHTNYTQHSSTATTAADGGARANVAASRIYIQSTFDQVQGSKSWACSYVLAANTRPSPMSTPSVSTLALSSPSLSGTSCNVQSCFSAPLLGVFQVCFLLHFPLLLLCCYRFCRWFNQSKRKSFFTFCPHKCRSLR